MEDRYPPLANTGQNRSAVNPSNLSGSANAAYGQNTPHSVGAARAARKAPMPQARPGTQDRMTSPAAGATQQDMQNANTGTMPSAQNKMNTGTMPSMQDKGSTGTMPATQDNWNAGTMPATQDKWNTGTMPTAQDNWNAGTMPTTAQDKWNTGTMPAAQDKWNTGTMPTAQDKWNAGTMPAAQDKWNTGTMPTAQDNPNMGTMPWQANPKNDGYGVQSEMTECSYKMGTLPPCAPLSAGFVPWQQENPPKYSTGDALTRGTLFPGLDLPYLNIVNKDHPYAGTPLGELMALGFVIKELNLYLDTHKNDRDALMMLQNMNKLMAEGSARFAQMYGPITISDIVSGDEFTWLNNPWPWDYTERAVSE